MDVVQCAFKTNFEYKLHPNEEHLTLNVQGLVIILEVIQRKLLRASAATLTATCFPKLVNLILSCELKHAVQASFNDLQRY